MSDLLITINISLLQLSDKCDRIYVTDEINERTVFMNPKKKALIMRICALAIVALLVLGVVAAAVAGSLSGNG